MKQVIRQRRTGTLEEIRKALRPIASASFVFFEEAKRFYFDWPDETSEVDGLSLRIFSAQAMSLYQFITDSTDLGSSPHAVRAPKPICEVWTTKAPTGGTWLTVVILEENMQKMLELWKVFDAQLSHMGFAKEVGTLDASMDEGNGRAGDAPVQKKHTPSTVHGGKNTDHQNDSEQKEPDRKPWLEIPDHGWDRKAVELLHKRFTDAEIASRLHLAPKTVTNRLSKLRQQYSELVPTRMMLREKALEMG